MKKQALAEHFNSSVQERLTEEKSGGHRSVSSGVPLASTPGRAGSLAASSRRLHADGGEGSDSVLPFPDGCLRISSLPDGSSA